MVSHQRQNSQTGVDLLDAEPELPIRHGGQLVLDLGHTPSHAEADFIVSPGNQLAFEHVIAFPNWSGPLSLISGPAKSGKSHLARIWAERAEAVHALPDALETLAGQGGTQPVLLEDVDRIAYDEQALFHLLNQCMRDGRPLLMTARNPVSQWPYQTADVLSRARLASNFPVETPDDIQLSQMLVKLFGDRQIAIDPKIIAYLVARMERSTSEAVAIVALMDKLALTRRVSVTRSIAAEALAIRAEAQTNSSGNGDPDE